MRRRCRRSALLVAGVVERDNEMGAAEPVELESISAVAIDLDPALRALIADHQLFGRLQRSPADSHSALGCGLHCGSTRANGVLLVTHRPHVFSQIA